MKRCTFVQEGCGYKDTLRASLLCSAGKIFHCVHYLSAVPSILNALSSGNMHQFINLRFLSYEHKYIPNSKIQY